LYGNTSIGVIFQAACTAGTFTTSIITDWMSLYIMSVGYIYRCTVDAAAQPAAVTAKPPATQPEPAAAESVSAASSQPEVAAAEPEAAASSQPEPATAAKLVAAASSQPKLAAASI
jgi:hypothetical protein